MEEYYVVSARCTDRTKKGLQVNEIASTFENTIVEFSEEMSKQDLESALKRAIVNKTASGKGAMIDVRMSEMRGNIWYSFKKSNVDVGCILMRKINGHIKEAKL